MHHLIPMTDPKQAYSVVMVKRKSKTISPRSMNAMQVGYTRYDHKDASCNRERTASVERELSSDEVEAQTSLDGSLQEDLFGDNQAQDLQSDRDAMNPRVEVQNNPWTTPIFVSNSKWMTVVQGLRNQLRTRCQIRITQLQMKHWTLVQ